MASATPRLGAVELRMLSELLRDHCGLAFGPDAHFLLERRLAPRIASLGLRSFMAYHALLRDGPEAERERAWAVDALVNNETYFFRERAQLEALVHEIVPERRAWREARGLGPVVIWSAGCSSGEEPYSVVMLALEADLEPGVDVRVVASDVSRPALERARRGRYRPSALRDTEPALRERYFREKEGGFELAEGVRRHVTFTRVNLLDRARLALLGVVDVVLCRNVLIYFDLETKRSVVRTFHEKLEPGGYLLLGHAESLVNLSRDFDLRQLTRELVYRKPAPGEAATDRWQLAAAAALGRADGEPER